VPDRAPPVGWRIQVEQTEALLRRLALQDEPVVHTVMAGEPGVPYARALDPKTHALVLLGALLAMAAGTTSLKCVTEAAYEAGATDQEIVGVLVAVGPHLGLVGLVREAPRLALAIGYDVEDVVA
jgi:4-carboxymuconolactone decarboxylase